jgi:hypothetical protein
MPDAMRRSNPNVSLTPMNLTTHRRLHSRAVDVRVRRRPLRLTEVEPDAPTGWSFTSTPASASTSLSEPATWVFRPALMHGKCDSGSGADRGDRSISVVRAPNAARPLRPRSLGERHCQPASIRGRAFRARPSRPTTHPRAARARCASTRRASSGLVAVVR